MTNRLANLRDLGGLPVAGGGRTRPGVLYRGDAPFSGDDAPTGVPHWPPGAVIDLRSPAERARHPHRWPDATFVHHLPLHGAAAPSERLPPDLVALYQMILRTAPHRVARLVGTLARADGPVLVHCAAGKDRTGIAVAALLLAAGVDPEAVVADYLATGANMDTLRRRWVSKGYRSHRTRPVPEAWLQVPEEAIAVVVELLGSGPGGAAGWLIDHGADRDDIVAWRTRIVGVDVDSGAAKAG